MKWFLPQATFLSSGACQPVSWLTLIKVKLLMFWRLSISSCASYQDTPVKKKFVLVSTLHPTMISLGNIQLKKKKRPRGACSSTDEVLCILIFSPREQVDGLKWVNGICWAACWIKCRVTLQFWARFGSLCFSSSAFWCCRRPPTRSDRISIWTQQK